MQDAELEQLVSIFRKFWAGEAVSGRKPENDARGSMAEAQNASASTSKSPTASSTSDDRGTDAPANPDNKHTPEAGRNSIVPNS